MNDKRSSGGKTLAYILLAMVAIIAVIVALGVWATRGG
jgi:flagellar biosynthesis/type III secretory pathway M-ring protein FliF/YscJ